MLFPETLHLFRQPIRIRSGEILQTMDPELLKHLPSFGTDAAHLTQVSLCSSLGIAESTPAAECALATIRRKGRRIVAIEIKPEFAQGVSKLLTQTSGHADAVPRRTAAHATTTHHQRIPHRCLLLLLQQQRHQGKRQLVFPGHAAALTRQHRLIGKGAPATAT